MTIKEWDMQAALGTLTVYVLGWRTTNGGNDLLGVYITKEAAKEAAKERFVSPPGDDVRVYEMVVGESFNYD